MYFKQCSGCFFASPPPPFLPDGWNVAIIAGAPATIWDQEVIMGMGTVHGGETRQGWPGPWPFCSLRVNPVLLSASLKKFPSGLFWISYPYSQNSS